MNRWVRFTVEEFVRTGALVALIAAFPFITVPFLMLMMYGQHPVPAMYGLALLHLVLVIVWVAHAFLYKSQHTWAVMRGRAKGIFKPRRLSWHWQIGYFIPVALCFVVKWWWVKAEARAAAPPVACADRCWSIVRLS